MSDVGEPTPMKREQDREAEIRARHQSWNRASQEAADVKWLLSELARLYWAALERFQAAARGEHDGTCFGKGCEKCFLEGVQPLLAVLRGRAAVGEPAPPRNLSAEITLCQETHLEAVRGSCPQHHGDACLRQYAPLVEGSERP